MRKAIALFKQHLEQKELEESARIYQEIYEADTELQELTSDPAPTEGARERASRD